MRMSQGEEEFEPRTPRADDLDDCEETTNIERLEGELVGNTRTHTYITI